MDAVGTAHLAGLAAFALTEDAAGAQRPSETILRTHLYAPETETYSLEPFVGRGGAIEVLGGDLLIATPQGRLALMIPDSAFRYPDGQIPMRGEGGSRNPLKPAGWRTFC